MNKTLWLAPLALMVGATAASPDTLMMDDGRRIQGDLISINRNLVIFDQANVGVRTRPRRLRLDRNSIRRISFATDSWAEETGTGPGYDRRPGDDRRPGYGRGGDVSDGRVGPNGTNGTNGGQGFDREVVVQADQPWTDTGFVLRGGEMFRVDADGSITWGVGRIDGPAGEMSSPYNANRPMPNRAGGALIGRIGNGDAFYIGSGQTILRASNEGRLYLGVNDDYLRDNSGSFRVSVGH